MSFLIFSRIIRIFSVVSCTISGPRIALSPVSYKASNGAIPILE
ncbi:hypothetical protein A2U01_0097982, partial [Trifolium medium]|nr:hypothetical protein [Trifolium medium]